MCAVIRQILDDFPHDSIHQRMGMSDLDALLCPSLQANETEHISFFYVRYIQISGNWRGEACNRHQKTSNRHSAAQLQSPMPAPKIGSDVESESEEENELLINSNLRWRGRQHNVSS